jgi:DHA3 family macrolide efflux protein-like MFS transporter
MDSKKLECNLQHISSILKNRTFILFLLSQGFSGFGDAFRFIAVTSLLVKVTGSGLSAGLGLVFSIVPCIVLSLFAGFTGDILNVRYLLISIELARSIIGLLFINYSNLYYIYILIILISSLDAFYNPPLRKALIALSGKKDVLKGNSLLSGTLAVTSILGSSAAGIIISTWGIESAFLANCYFHSIAVIFLLLLKISSNRLMCDNINIFETKYEFRHRTNYNHRYKSNYSHRYSPEYSPRYKSKYDINSNSGYSIKTVGIREAWYYIKETIPSKKAIIANIVVGFGVVSVNMAFYPFAFDNLRVGEKGWGFMMSIFYGSNLIAMGIALWLNKKLRSMQKKKYIYDLTIYISLILVSCVWFIYSFMRYLPLILLMQLLEGTLIHLCGILLISKLQSFSKEVLLGRITGLNDFLCSLSKVIGISFTYFIIQKFDPGTVFSFNSICLMTFALLNLFNL